MKPLGINIFIANHDNETSLIISQHLKELIPGADVIRFPDYDMFLKISARIRPQLVVINYEPEIKDEVVDKIHWLRTIHKHLPILVTETRDDTSALISNGATLCLPPDTSIEDIAKTIADFLTNQATKGER